MLSWVELDIVLMIIKAYMVLIIIGDYDYLMSCYVLIVFNCNFLDMLA